MKYDPIKESLGNIFNHTPQLRILFYKMLDLLLLRTWHIKYQVKKLFGNDVNRSLRILDAGMGFGQYSYWLSSKFPKCTLLGVDIKEEEVDNCNHFFSQVGRNNCSFECADLTKFQTNEKYDFVLNVDVMEHILEDEQVLQNFHNALIENGILLISTPSDQGGSDAHDEDDASFVGEHVRNGYSISDITEKLTKAGFKNIQANYSYGTFGHISWILSMKFPILMLNFSKWLAPFVAIYYIITFLFCLLFNALDVHFFNSKGTGLIISAQK